MTDKTEISRNVAIIAHVDHGKTTLVDQLLWQSGTFRDNQEVSERAMDKNALERERGITILAKCTSVLWDGKDGDGKDCRVRINIIDTPGHADFGGEVERILSMVDGVVLLVDAAEGPMPQTKFVTSKALKLGLCPIVVVNKIDRPDARVDDVHFEILELFSSLGANEQQLNFPVVYASGKKGWACLELGDVDNAKDMNPLFETIVRYVPPPLQNQKEENEKSFAMLVTLIESDPYLGRILTGRVMCGTVHPNDSIQVLRPEKGVVERARVSKVMAFHGLERVPTEEAHAGDIIAIAGLTHATVADTLCAASEVDAQPLSSLPIDPPTLAITLSINTSPLAGREGSKVQSRVIRERLMREAEGNVAIQVKESQEKDAYEVAGRGELQLGVLIETMRREGFELSISRPRVLVRKDPETGQDFEPYEEVTLDVDEAYSGVVVEKLSMRKGELREMVPGEGGKTRLVFLVPARCLIGYHGEFLTDTRGTGVMNRRFESYGPYKGAVETRRCGVLIANAQGDTSAYALFHLEPRGILFIGAGVTVYEGMIIGEHTKPGDLDVNPLKAKQLTNMRASGKDDAIRLSPPRALTLEQAMAYIANDELVEITPLSIRLRKRFLNPVDRKRNKKDV